MEVILFVGLALLIVFVLIIRSRGNNNTIEVSRQKRVPRVESAANSGVSPQAIADPQGLSDSQLGDALREMLRSGHKIEAIKVLRTARNLGLKEAKDAVDAMADGNPFRLLEALAELAAKQESKATQNPLENHEDVKWLLSQGKKIEAIKLMREQTGLGLAEAKDAVEAMERS